MGLARVGTREFFLGERYLLYTVWAGRLYLSRIHHQPWPLQDAEVSRLDETLLSAARIARPDAPPLAHYAREQRVEVFASERVS